MGKYFYKGRLQCQSLPNRLSVSNKHKNAAMHNHTLYILANFVNRIMQ